MAAVKFLSPDVVNLIKNSAVWLKLGLNVIPWGHFAEQTSDQNIFLLALVTSLQNHLQDQSQW